MDDGIAFVTGRLTRDPQFFGEGEKRRVVFSIAFNRGKDERRKTTFVDCIAWGKRADILDSFRKGSGVSVKGDLETDSWDDKEGNKHTRLRLNVQTITATTSNRRETEDGDVGGAEETNTTAPAATKRGGTPVATGRKGGRDEEADIPF